MNHQNCADRCGTVRWARRFLRDDEGAVTVDWVVLTAAIVLMGIAAGFTVSANVPVVADKIDEVLRSQTVVPD